MYYAGIGSRRTPDEVLRQMSSMAQSLRHQGLTLRSGGAAGADEAFEVGAKDKKQIFKPGDPLTQYAIATVDRFHPAPERLSDYARRLHARNAMILFGRENPEALGAGYGDLSKMVQFIICWTPGGRVEGGTGQAMRIASYYNIPIINLYRYE